MRCSRQAAQLQLVRRRAAARRLPRPEPARGVIEKDSTADHYRYSVHVGRQRVQGALQPVDGILVSN